MREQDGVYVAGAATYGLNYMIEEVRGSFWNSLNPRFIAVVLFSILLHIAFIMYSSTIEIEQEDPLEIERVPERFARLIVDRPPPRGQTVSEAIKKAGTERDAAKGESDLSEQKAPPATRAQAKQAVVERTEHVEQKVRNVGVLGMLTGTGETTKKGGSVADVLGSIEPDRRRSRNLDEAIEGIKGLQRTERVDVLDQKLVRTKDVSVSHRESIDDLVAGIGGAKTADLARRGEFVIQRPESIEGAASSSAKRDQSAINKIVTSHRASLRMSYQRHLRRNPELGGVITVRFTIAASGSVVSVNVISNTTGNSELEQDIVRRIRLWRFDAIPEGEVTVTYPFVFSPAG
ncbi:putative abductin-like protein [Chitinispirillum alkaliphilum]|nr:putative abductin-like protein [Chitinispirillum alkaliphilum]